MEAATIRKPTEFEERLRRYLFERSEEARAVRVGEKEVSEQAEIVRRYEDLFTRAQLDALRGAEAGASGRRARAALPVCERRARAVSSRRSWPSARTSSRTAYWPSALTFKGEEMPLRSAQARLAVLPAYADREELGQIQAAALAGFNDDTPRADPLERGARRRAIRASPTRWSGTRRRRRSRSASSRRRSRRRATSRPPRSWRSAKRWFEKLLGPAREEVPSSFHTSYMRRLSPLETTYTKERATEVCLDTLSELGFDLAASTDIKLDLDDRPQKAPRACVIASDPPHVVHLITRAQGGLHDYQAFLHEAGHALHYAGCDPDLPYTFRRISRDHALTEIYSYICEAVTREPGWHARYFGLSDEQAAENAEATVFLEALLFRRYVAKLRFELGFWSRFADDGGTAEGYEEYLTAGDGNPLSQRRLPERHGRRLLLGRLPPRLDPLRPAPPPPDRDRRRGLVEKPGNRRGSWRRCSARGRSRRARRSRRGSASIRST